MNAFLAWPSSWDGVCPGVGGSANPLPGPKRRREGRPAAGASLGDRVLGARERAGSVTGPSRFLTSPFEALGDGPGTAGPGLSPSAGTSGSPGGSRRSTDEAAV